VLLAVTYNTFKALMASEVVLKHGRMFANFDVAFNELVRAFPTAANTTSAAAVAPNPLNPGAGAIRTSVREDAAPLNSWRGASAGIPRSTWQPGWLPALSSTRKRSNTDVQLEASAADSGAGLGREVFARFYAHLRPDVPTGAALRFFDIFDTDCRGVVRDPTPAAPRSSAPFVSLDVTGCLCARLLRRSICASSGACC